MARQSKLTDKQWMEIGERLLAGESGRALAKEFGLSETAIRKRLGSQCEEIKTVAHQLFEADKALKALPISSQVQARTLADDLKAISEHLASAAKYGSMTAHRLSHIAHVQTNMIDETAPLELNMPALKGVAAFTATANEAAKIGLNLLAANKEMIAVGQEGDVKKIVHVNAPGT